MTNGETLVAEENITISKSEKPGFHLLIRQIITLPAPLPETINDKIIRFWAQRRITFSAVSDKMMYGQRGSLGWNAITFDMSKLRSDLAIHLDKEQGKVECLLNVKTTLQQITPMNQMYWVEEMSAFDSYLHSGDERKEEWVEFQKEYRKDNRRWVWGIAVTAGIAVLAGQVAGGLLSWLISLLTGSK